MQFFSTRDTNRKVTSSEAIAQGLSDEGGLFVPESFPQVDVRALCELDYPALAAAVIREYLTDYSPEFLAQAARTTYGEAFGGKAGYLAPVEGDTYALELWHGPTCAFKDYALQLMPRLLVEAKKNLGRTEKTLILVATSGDTGKAALDGYHDIPGVEIAVFYPTGGTSEIQRLQMATQEGANVAVYAVRGNFDDAQTGVKKVFGDKAIAARLAELGRVPYSAEKFFVKHQDRILFGTDCTPLSMGYHKIYYRFFETKDEYFPYQPEGELPGQGRWAIYGIGLEDEILKKIYYKNACKVLSLDENRFVGGVR